MKAETIRKSELRDSLKSLNYFMRHTADMNGKVALQSAFICGLKRKSRSMRIKK